MRCGSRCRTAGATGSGLRRVRRHGQNGQGIALGRKNWLFAGSDEGAERAAIINTVIETAVRHGVDVWKYLYDVLIKLSAGWPMRRLAELLPENWRELHAPSS
jgi:hypothetical protein